MKFEYKTECKAPKRVARFFFKSNFFILENAILQILTQILFDRLIVATHKGLVFLMVLLQLTAKTK